MQGHRAWGTQISYWTIIYIFDEIPRIPANESVEPVSANNEFVKCDYSNGRYQDTTVEYYSPIWRDSCIQNGMLFFL